MLVKEEGFHSPIRPNSTLLWHSLCELGKLHNLSGPQFPVNEVNCTYFTGLFVEIKGIM